ncbi:hypothetical protein BOTBODRAFT_175038 [Botryobasidium botryosum FD-172 SS1]|uniref:Reverse transcriptase domain-containing protein n=1 Tax=Botryobasidium botryosum (strain FD-172 SS1) TaxID=930990 RepID=A0A067MEF1_BOTB1|nr:hypothetical protein BOTBODRAFT_175038 [Botryobasidium botryosum FD-172 SS1]
MRTTFHVDGIVSDEFDIEEGIPQGSPLSPALAIIFTSDIKPFVRRYLSKIKGISHAHLEELLMYVDDGLFVLWTGNKWERIAELIPHLLAALNAWANSFGISIDPGKTEVMWLFPDGRSPPPPLPGLNVVEVMRWLGVDYDQKLTFNAHVANILKKANNNMAPLDSSSNSAPIIRVISADPIADDLVFHFTIQLQSSPFIHHIFLSASEPITIPLHPLFVIKRLSGGVSAAAALRFYLGAIRPILTYSAPTWWTDKAAHGDKLNSYQYRLLNRCLGMFRNTRTWVTLAMTGVPPLNAHLNMVVELYVSRIPYYFASHPTRKIVLSILALIDAMANMPAHLLVQDIALVIANRALVDSLVHPNRRTVYHSHLHELASRRILDSQRIFHIFVINKWHVLHPPKKAFYYHPPTYVPASFQDHCQSRRVTTRKIKQILAQSFAEDLEAHIPQDHIFRTFDLIREATDTSYPTFIALQRPASQTAALACLASGHTFVGSYYKSRNIPDTEYSCPCGVDVQDIPHVFLDCPITAPFKHLLLDDDGDLDTSLLFTDKLDSLIEWLKATNAFTKRFGLVTIGTPPPQGSGSLPSPPVLSVVD